MRNDYGTTIFKDIENHRKLIKKQKKEIEERQMIIDSLTNSMVHTIRRIITPYSDKMLHSAWCQQNKPKEERAMFEFVKNDLLERLFDKDEIKEVEFIKIIPLMSSGNCVYSFQFKYEGITFEVAVPNVQIANDSNVYSMDYGMYVLRYEEKRSIWNHITESYDLDDIAKAIKEFIYTEIIADDN